MTTLVIGRRHVYRDYLRDHGLDSRDVRHVTSPESLQGQYDVDFLFLPYWWEAYSPKAARAIEDQVRLIEALR